MRTKTLGGGIFRRGRKQHKVSAPPEITEGGLKIWIQLPEQVKHDPTLMAYRSEYERSTGHMGNNHHSVNNGHPEGYLGSNLLSSVVLDRIEVLPDEAANEETIEESTKCQNTKKWLNSCKTGFLLIIWVFFTGFMMVTNEKELVPVSMSVPANRTRIYRLAEGCKSNYFELHLLGAFTIYPNDSNTLTVHVQAHLGNSSEWTNIDQWIIAVDDIYASHTSPTMKLDHLFDIAHKTKIKEIDMHDSLQIAMETNFDTDFPFQFIFDPSPVNKKVGIIYATLILIGLYVLIIWEIIDKVLATIIASTLSISVLAAMGARPTLWKVMSWIDMETLLLLFGMMIVVGILSETGLFDYLAVYAYKITNGKAWPLIYCLCLFTAILSALLDNVTTLLLMAPVSIRLCQIMNLNPIPILTCMILYSNIGGALTPVGDPPNIIIISNAEVGKSGITFANFILHMLIGVLLAGLQTFLQLRFKYPTISHLRAAEPKEVSQLREEIEVWQLALDSISLHSNDDDFIRWTLVEKVKHLKTLLKKQLKSGSIPEESFHKTLRDLEAKYPIKNKALLIKSLVAATFTLGFFFLHSVPGLDRLSLGWVAFLGALLLLILADKDDMDAALSKVEWSTLIFFTSLFVLIEAVSDLGLIDWIGDQTKNIVISVNEGWRLPVATLIIVWVTAVASSFLDNIPLTAMMIKVTIALAQNEVLGLPLTPLIYALSFGACFGGNGTLLGASANIVCASVAKQHGLKLSFYEYFKTGFPTMIGNVLMASIYLLIVHVLLKWY